jgi:hypothetical protein
LARSRIAKLVRKDEDREKLLKILEEVYPKIKSVYRYYSSYELSGDVFSVSRSSFIEFLTSVPGILDGQRFKLRDLDIVFVSSNTM